jgi:WD40 repeat protein
MNFYLTLGLSLIGAGHSSLPGVAAELPRGTIATLGTTAWRHDTDIVQICWSPSGRLIACAGGNAPTGSVDYSIRILDAQTGNSIRRLRGHKAEISALRFSEDEHLIISSDNIGTVCMWDVATGECRWTASPAEFKDVWLNRMAIAFSVDAKRVGILSTSGRAVILDAATGSQLDNVPFSSTFCAAWDKKLHIKYVGDSCSDIRHAQGSLDTVDRSAEALKPFRAFKEHSGGVLGLSSTWGAVVLQKDDAISAFTESGKVGYAVASRSSACRSFDPMVQLSDYDPLAAICCMTTDFQNAQVFIIDLLRGECLNRWHCPNQIVPNAIALSPGGKKVAIARGSTVTVSTVSPTATDAELHDCRGFTRSCSLSPDRTMLVALDSNADALGRNRVGDSVRVWDLKREELTATIAEPVDFAMWLDNERRLAIVSGNRVKVVKCDSDRLATERQFELTAGDRQTTEWGKVASNPARLRLMQTIHVARSAPVALLTSCELPLQADSRQSTQLLLSRDDGVFLIPGKLGNGSYGRAYVSPTGKRALIWSKSPNEDAEMIDLPSGESSWRIRGAGRDGAVFSEDERLVAIACVANRGAGESRGTVWIHSVADGHEQFALQLPNLDVGLVGFLKAGRLIVTTHRTNFWLRAEESVRSTNVCSLAEDGVCTCVWDLKNKKEILRFDGVEGICTDSTLLVVQGTRGEMHVLDLAKYDELDSYWE